MQLIHYVEDLFISYAFDVIKRVLSDFESQKEIQSSQSSFQRNYMSDYHTEQIRSYKYDINYSLAISSSLLLKDIQTYADQYHEFRQHYSEYFNLSQEEEKQIHTVNNEIQEESKAIEDSADLTSDFSEDQFDPDKPMIEVDENLSKSFICLKLIDKYRVKNDIRYIDELKANFTDETSESYEIF